MNPASAAEGWSSCLQVFFRKLVAVHFPTIEWNIGKPSSSRQASVI
jgi:hypothetical protein